MFRGLSLFCVLVGSKIHEPDTDGFFRIKQSLNSSELVFTVLGDFGGFPKPFYTTPIQINAASLLAEVSESRKSSFNLGIGDNFYFWGVKDTSDIRFKKSFEDVYYQKSLQIPWYIQWWLKIEP